MKDKNSWSSGIASFFKRLLTVNLISCVWVVWAVVSIFVFITLLTERLLNTFWKNGLDGLLKVNDDFKFVFSRDELFMDFVVLEVIIAGLLALGWVFFKVLFWIMDKIQALFGTSEDGE